MNFQRLNRQIRLGISPKIWAKCQLIRLQNSPICHQQLIHLPLIRQRHLLGLLTLLVEILQRVELPELRRPQEVNPLAELKSQAFQYCG